jgi:flagellar hook-associated protein 2
MGLRIGAVTFGGLSSGINSSEIIEQLVELERRPVTVLESQKSDFEDKRSLLQDLNTRVLTLRNRLRDLDNMNLLGTDLSVDQEFRKFSATSSDTDIAKVTATGSAKPGNLEIQITSLAQNEREISQGYADRDTTTVGTGSFSITLRQGFADEKTIGVTVDSSNNTLDGFVAAINDADPEVRAFVLDDGSANPYRIVIEGANTGVEETLDLDTSGLSGGTTPVFAETQAASDATLILDPSDPDAITINSATNTFASVIQGLTIEAVSASVGTDVRIKVEPDQDEIVTAIQDVVAAYNDVIDIIETQSQVDPTTNRGGPLIGDSTLLTRMICASSSPRTWTQWRRSSQGRARLRTSSAWSPTPTSTRSTGSSSLESTERTARSRTSNSRLPARRRGSSRSKRSSSSSSRRSRARSAGFRLSPRSWSSSY